MSPWISWSLYGTLFVYNILDAYHTKIILSIGGKEINPLMDYIINHFGIDSLFVVKIIVFVTLGTLLFLNQKKNRIR